MKKILCAVCAAILAAGLSGCGADSSAAEKNKPAETKADSVSSADAADTDVTEETAASDTSEEEISKKAVCADITASILESIEFPSMAEVTAERAEIYIDFAIPEGCDFSMYICGSGGFADEVCVISGDFDSDAFEAAVEKRINSRKRDFEGYNPDEFDKLEDYYFEYSDGFAIYTVTADNDTSARIFEEMVK